MLGCKGCTFGELGAREARGVRGAWAGARACRRARGARGRARGARGRARGAGVSVRAGRRAGVIAGVRLRAHGWRWR
ncbi:hypothetical protein CRG98_049154, partial [Punica granatum]